MIIHSSIESYVVTKVRRIIFKLEFEFEFSRASNFQLKFVNQLNSIIYLI